MVICTPPRKNAQPHLCGARSYHTSITRGDRTSSPRRIVKEDFPNAAAPPSEVRATRGKEKKWSVLARTSRHISHQSQTATRRRGAGRKSQRSLSAPRFRGKKGKIAKKDLASAISTRRKKELRARGERRASRGIRAETNHGWRRRRPWGEQRWRRRWQCDQVRVVGQKKCPPPLPLTTNVFFFLCKRKRKPTTAAAHF